LAIDGLHVANVVEVYNEILEASDFATLIQVLVEELLGTLLASASPFDLDLAPIISDMLGGSTISARINGIQRSPGEENDFLVAYLTFCDEADMLNPDFPPCYSPGAKKSAGMRSMAGPTVYGTPTKGEGRVVLAVDPALEYQYRVNGGVWSGFRSAPAGLLSVKRAILGFPGSHTIELRSRRPGAYWTRSANIISVPIEISD